MLFARHDLVHGLYLSACGLILILSACSTPPSHVAGRPAQDTVYIVAHGWHAGVTIPVAYGEGLLQGPLEGSAAEHVEVGWGDRYYYPDPEPSLGTLLRAALWPSSSTLHVVAVPYAVPEYFRRNEIVAIPTPDSLLIQLRAYLLDAFARDEDGAFVPHEDARYGDGHFFKGTERYHVFNNCNHWVARALRAIGCEVSVFQSLTLGSLMRQAEACGKTYQRSDS
jgi:uncharacterized protein (TIGR02117 family)